MLRIWSLFAVVAAILNHQEVFSQQYDEWYINLDPSEPNVTMDETLSINFNVTGPQHNFDVILLTASRNPDILEASNEIPLKRNDSNRYYSGHFNVTGVFLGKADVTLEVKRKDENNPIFEDSVRIKVVRRRRAVDTVFTISVATLVSLIYINFGCALNWGELMTSLKKPFGPVIGFFGQFVVMPLLSFGLAKLLFPDNLEMQLGMFFAGVSPGGGASNMWTVLLEGNVNLSITMTTISNLAAFFMMPFWIFTLGRQIFEEGDMPIPYGDISMYAGALVGPLFIGFLIQRYLKKIGQFMARILKGFSAVLTLFIIIFAIATNLYLFQLFSWKIIVAGLGLPWLGYILAFILAKICKQSAKDSLTIAIETGIQNTGISIFLLRFTLPQPEADITTVMPVAVATMTPFPLMFLYLYQKIRKRFFPVGESKEVLNKSVTDLETIATANGKQKI